MLVPAEVGGRCLGQWLGQRWAKPGKEESPGWAGTVSLSDGEAGTTTAVVGLSRARGPQPGSESGEGFQPLRLDYPSIPRIPSALSSSWCQSRFFSFGDDY